MPLPVEAAKLAWPPAALAKHYDVVRTHAAWWAGDPDELALAYSGSTAQDSFSAAAAGRTRFWSRRSRDGSKNRTQLHVPLASDVATTSADLLFAQPPQLAFNEEGMAGQDYLDELADAAGLANLWLEGGEAAAALSGVYLRPSWDTEAAGYPFVTVVQPDHGVPTWQQGILIEVTFFTVLQDPGTGHTVWRHLENHRVEGGQWLIEHGLYAGTKDFLGVRQELGLHPVVQHLPEEPIATGVPFLGVAYVPNMRPNRKDRHSPMGRSDFQGLEGLMDSLDEVWSEWMLELKLARARIIVPETYLDTTGAGKGQTFDYDREVFTPVAVPTAPGLGDQLTMTAFPIRSDKFAATATALVEQIVNSAGYSPQDFGLHIEGRAESGTALRLRRARSLATTAKKQRYWAPAISRVSLALAYLAAQLFGEAAPADGARVTVNWQDELDLPEMATTVELMSRAQAASVETMVRLLHPEWSDAEVEAEVALLREEGGMMLPDPMQIDQLP